MDIDGWKVAEIAFGSIVSPFVAWLVKSHISTTNRLTRLETLLSTMGEKFSTILHSPHSPIVDEQLEKFQRLYRDQHYDLTDAEWQEFYRVLKSVEVDTELPKSERLLAGTIILLAEHKLMRTGKVPRP